MKRAISHVILLIGITIVLFPFVWMVSMSFKPFVESLSTNILPSQWTLDNYAEILGRAGFLTAFRNSTIVAVPSVLMVLLTSTAAGYIFAKYKFWGKEVAFTAILGTMMIPFATVIVPLFLTMRDIGLVDKLAGLIITSACSTFGIFLMRSTIESIPNDYIEAARIDGAPEFWILLRVIMPLARPAMATLAVFTFLGNWDSYMWPSILLRSPGTKTVPLAVAAVQSLRAVRYPLWAAGSMLTVLPVMVLFIIAQRHFIKGLAMTGLKG
jgi:multiple sugar transport system permease protein